MLQRISIAARLCVIVLAVLAIYLLSTSAVAQQVAIIFGLSGGAPQAITTDGAGNMNVHIVSGGVTVPLPLPTNGIAATSTDAVTLTNSTAATAGVQVQQSGRLRFTGQGWRTNATAQSETVDWIVENIPATGTADPSTSLQFSSQINGNGYTPLASPSNARFAFRSDNYIIGTDSVGSAGILIGGNSAVNIVPSMGATGTNFGVVSAGFNFKVSAVSNLVYTANTGFSTYNARATAGFGVPLVFGVSSTTGNSAAVSNFINYTPPATAGTYRVDLYIDVTAWTTPASSTATCTYTDPTGASRTQTLSFQNGAGTLAATIAATGQYSAQPFVFGINNGAVAITCSTVTFTGTPTYSINAVLTQLR